MTSGKTGLVVTAHPGDFVWRAGGAIALHARKGYGMKIVCLSFGERGESQWAWKKGDVSLDEVKAQRREEAERAAQILGAEIEFFDAGDYPLRPTPEMLDRLVDVYRELKPSFVLTHSLEDPYNGDHPEAARFAQEARIVAQAAGHKPEPRSCLRRAAGLPVRAAPARAVQLQAQRHPQHRRGVGDEAQGIRGPRRAEASVGVLHARRAQSRRAGRAQLRHAR